MHVSRWIGNVVAGIGFSVIIIILLIGYKAFNFPQQIPVLHHALFFGLTRPAFVTCLSLILSSLFTGHLCPLNHLLSHPLLRLLSRTLPVACLSVLTVTQVLVCSQNMEKGYSVGLNDCITIACGMILISLTLSVPIHSILIFPMSRMLDFEWLSHDGLLEKKK